MLQGARSLRFMMRVVTIPQPSQKETTTKGLQAFPFRSMPYSGLDCLVGSTLAVRSTAVSRSAPCASLRLVPKFSVPSVLVVILSVLVVILHGLVNCFTQARPSCLTLRIDSVPP